MNERLNTVYQKTVRRVTVLNASLFAFGKGAIAPTTGSKTVKAACFVKSFIRETPNGKSFVQSVLPTLVVAIGAISSDYGPAILADIHSIPCTFCRMAAARRFA